MPRGGRRSNPGGRPRSLIPKSTVSYKLTPAQRARMDAVFAEIQREELYEKAIADLPLCVQLEPYYEKSIGGLAAAVNVAIERIDAAEPSKEAGKYRTACLRWLRKYEKYIIKVGD